MKLFTKKNIYICLLLIIIICYFYVTRYSIKESLETQPLDEKLSITATGVDNIVNLNEAEKERDIINVNYNNQINQKEISYADGNGLIKTYGEIFPLQKEDTKLDAQLTEYRNSGTQETDHIREKLHEYNTEISIIQKELETYNKIESQYQKIIAKKSALDNDTKNINSELSYSEKKIKASNLKIEKQQEEIKNLEEELNKNTYNEKVKIYSEYASKYNELSSKLEILNRKPCAK